MSREEMKARAERWTALMSQRYDDMITKAQQETVFYGEGDVKVPTDKVEGSTEILLVDLDSVSAIHKFKEGKTAVLNFASYKNPGGGFINGMMAQEESLCHHSFLFNVLQAFSSYYAWNRCNLNGGFYLDRAIYSPGILFDEKTKCDVITCAAPNASRMLRYNTGEESKNEFCLLKRVLYVLNIAASQGVDTLILGAYGCGVFKQNPEVVAWAFNFYLQKYFKGVFKRVVFAIPDKEGKNYKAFEHELNF